MRRPRSEGPRTASWRGPWSAPLLLALLVLAGSLTTTFVLYAAATGAVDKVLVERLEGAGASAVELMPRSAMTDPSAVTPLLLRLVEVNALDAAYVVDSDLRIVSDAHGRAGRPINLLRVDPERLDLALKGEASVGLGYSVGSVGIVTAYFPMRRIFVTGAPTMLDRADRVLVLEGGPRFLAARRSLVPALIGGVGLSVATAVLLAMASIKARRAEHHRARFEAMTLRARALGEMSATAAHEIRNPLGVIRATVELMRERSGAGMGPRDRSALDDVLFEVDRLHRLTEDFIELSGSRPLNLAPLQLRDVIEEAARATEAAFPEVRIERRIEALPSVRADEKRLRQVFSNLLVNAAQARTESARDGETTTRERDEDREPDIVVEAQAKKDSVTVFFHDRGPGMDEETQRRIFEPYFTTRASGTGLGLALSRRFIERHQGTLRLVSSRAGARTTFEIRLPVDGPIPRGSGAAGDEAGQP